MGGLKRRREDEISISYQSAGLDKKRKSDFRTGLEEKVRKAGLDSNSSLDSNSTQVSLVTNFGTNLPDKHMEPKSRSSEDIF